MRFVILGKFYLLTPQFPKKGGVGLTYTRLSLSFIPSLNILCQKHFIYCQEMSYRKMQAKVMQFMVTVMRHGLNSCYY